MLEIVYISKARQPFSRQAMLDLLQIARLNNRSRQITGMLLFDGRKMFIQVLEGPEAEVRELFARIGKDPRHSEITVLGENTITARQYNDWSMAFQQLDEEDWPDWEKVNDTLVKEKSSKQYKNKYLNFAKKMLNAFYTKCHVPATQ